ncbi:tellurite resistance TerB family protein [Pseudaestuariivita sp.]|uniref:tellurite resistance TerB family protein n=1 Tax=Pseudaestuariivita sp. TaxID=2211669 RepID=UPI0040599C04
MILDRFRALFAHPAPEPLPEPDARLALGALLVRVAKSDTTYRVAEIQQIDRILALRNALGPIEAAKLRATCEKIEAEAPETEEFAALIRETVPYPERVGAVQALWQVVLADGVRHENEEALVSLIEGTLGVSRADSAAARAEVMG